ncbi:hypothetical protein AMTR_s00041p00158090 [Amborella trichopoda]|uniref:Uncharacterized protein n=1 Tax=Amborella trichopoda TaxID=13333 RepID=W1PZ20_AMBTC|nr:hypothetical protein AMTR_s00041p00158090 [Amborella trichopoda]
MGLLRAANGSKSWLDQSLPGIKKSRSPPPWPTFRVQTQTQIQTQIRLGDRTGCPNLFSSLEQRTIK